MVEEIRTHSSKEKELESLIHQCFNSADRKISYHRRRPTRTEIGDYFDIEKRNDISFLGISWTKKQIVIRIYYDHNKWHQIHKPSDWFQLLNIVVYDDNFMEGARYFAKEYETIFKAFKAKVIIWREY